MNEPAKPTFPYRRLGLALKLMREQHRESIAEVSGAVEIDITDLSKIELGHMRPSEAVLSLLISHFETKEDDADKLWDLAGYSRKATVNTTFGTVEEELSTVPTLLVSLPLDNRVLYTDVVHVVVNNHGVVMNFMQGQGNNGQPTTVARVGMSRDHAKSVLNLLQRTLAQSEPKKLSDGRK